MTLRGIDYSHHQGTVDIDALTRKLGLSFAVVKATQGESFVDSRFAQNWQALRGSGLVRGAYSFASPDGDARDDVDAFLELITRSTGGLLPTDLLVCDLEASRLSAGATAAWAVEWARHLVRRTEGAFTPVLYCGGYMDLAAYRPLAKAFPVWWYPRYPAKYDRTGGWPANDSDLRLPSPNIVYGRRPDFWQFSQSMPAGGQPFDANVYFGTLDQLKAINPGARKPAGPPPGTGELDMDETTLRRIIREEVAETLGLGDDGKIGTGWNSDGSHGPDPQRITVAKALAETRGKTVQLAALEGLPVAGTPTPPRRP